jgi:DnaA family protein
MEIRPKNGCEIVPDLTLTSIKTNTMRQLLLNILPAPTPTQDNFVPGSNNETLAAWQHWLNDTNNNFRTGSGFYLFGESGSGKSHLLLSSGLPYVDAAVNSGLTELPSLNNILAVDNVQLLNSDGEQQLFNLFNQIHADGGRLLMAGEVSPKNLSLREDLRTRLGYGLVYGLLPLNDCDKIAALTRLAQDRQLRIGSDLIPYLIRHTPRDMGNLTILLQALDSYGLEHKRAITLPLLRELLQTPLDLET